jgi:phage-related minor tail protein
MNSLDDLSAQIAQLEARLGPTTDMVSAFDAEMAQMGRTLTMTGREVEGMTRSFGTGLRRAFDGVVFDGGRLSDAMRRLGQSITNTLYNSAMRPVQNALGGTLASGLAGVMSHVMPFAQGGAFSQGRVMPFAKGGVVSGPVMFPMRGGMGLMGEAGPEAIMPLTRGTDGRLGVRADGDGARPINVVFNISTPDVAGFQRSQSQIAAQMNRLLAQGQRNG